MISILPLKRSSFFAQVSKQNRGQQLMDTLCENFRELKSKLKQVSAESERLLQDAKEVIDKVENVTGDSCKSDQNVANMNIDDVIKLLEAKCGEKKKLAAKLREGYNQV